MNKVEIQTESNLPSAITYMFASMVVGGNTLLKNVNFEIKQSDKVLITGANGSGKSSLLKRLAAEVFEPNSSLTYFNEDARSLSTKRIAQLRHQVFQTDVPYPNFSVFEYLSLSRHAFGESNSTVTDELVGDFGLSEIIDRRIQHLSGGEWMRTRIAMAWSSCAPIILLDEVENSLDEYFRVKIFNMLLASDRTVLAISHNAEVKSLNWNTRLEITDGEVQAL
jgi:ABC-type multidrug transport system ATPase subunit